ncbi:Cdc4, F-box and WD-40 protein [Pseudoloma neurophilia]|uniref:Cdc4, F-box and WD-40 protein n=1 Tax=Pseudoloma neurophilia TaxID=146866 RepID=A0A0R0LUX9_9MICR|nr:Cdc4, F-box and WD-40 protein [Pseudoloma neurophilia]
MIIKKESLQALLKLPNEISIRIQTKLSVTSLLYYNQILIIQEHTWMWRCIKYEMDIQILRMIGKKSQIFTESNYWSKKTFKFLFFTIYKRLHQFLTIKPLIFTTKQKDTTVLKLTENYIILGSDDKSVLIYDYKGQHLQSLMGHNAGIWTLQAYQKEKSIIPPLNITPVPLKVKYSFDHNSFTEDRSHKKYRYAINSPVEQSDDPETCQFMDKFVSLLEKTQRMRTVSQVNKDFEQKTISLNFNHQNSLIPRDFNHQNLRDFNHQNSLISRDSLNSNHQNPRDFYKQSPLNFNHQNPRDFYEQSPLNSIHQNPRDFYEQSPLNSNHQNSRYFKSHDSHEKIDINTVNYNKDSEKKDQKTKINPFTAQPGLNVITGCVDKSIRIFSTGIIATQTLAFHSNTVRCIKLTPSYILSAGRDGIINIFTKEGLLLKKLKSHTKSIRMIEWYENFMVSGGYDGQVLLWRVKDPQCESNEKMTVHKKSSKSTQSKNISDNMRSDNIDDNMRSDNIGDNIGDNMRSDNVGDNIGDNFKSNNLKTDNFKSNILEPFLKAKEPNFFLYKKLRSHLQRVYCVTISKKFIISGGDDQLINISDRNGNFLYRIEGHRGIITGLEILRGYHMKINKNDEIKKIYKNGKYLDFLLPLSKIPAYRDKYLISVSSDGLLIISNIFTKKKKIFNVIKPINCYFIYKNIIFIGVDSKVKMFILDDDLLYQSKEKEKNNIDDKQIINIMKDFSSDGHDLLSGLSTVYKIEGIENKLVISTKKDYTTTVFVYQLS